MVGLPRIDDDTKYLGAFDWAWLNRNGRACAVVIFYSGRRVDALKAERQGPRHLTVKQRGQFIALLKARPTGNLLVWQANNDSEVATFAQELVEAITAAGWTVNHETEGTVLGAGKGLHIEMHDPLNFAAGGLQGALEAIDFPADGIINKAMEGEIRLTVGEKP